MTPNARQVLDFPFVGGLDTKTDRLQTKKLLECLNGVFTRPGRIQLRNGFAQLRNQFNPPGTPQLPGTGKMLASFADEVVTATDAALLASYSPTQKRYLFKGEYFSCDIDQKQIVCNSNQQTQQDMGFHPSGVICTAWEDSSGALMYCLNSLTSTLQLVGPTAIKSGGSNVTGIKPRVLPTPAGFAIFFYDTTHQRIYASVVNLGSSTAAGMPVAITGTSGVNQLDTTYPNYDAAAFVTASYGNTIALAFPNAAGSNQITVYVINPSNLTQLYASGQITGSVKGSAACPITVFADTAGTAALPASNICIGWSANNGGLGDIWFAAIDPTLTTLGSLQKITTAGTVAVTLTGGAGGGQLLFAFDTQIQNGSIRLYFIEPGSWIPAASPTQPPTQIGLAAKLPNGYLAGQSVPFVVTVHQDVEQSTYLITDQSATEPIGRLLYGEAGGLPTRSSNGSPMLPSVPQVGTFSWLVPMLNQNTQRVSTALQDDPWTITGISAAVLNFNVGYTHADFGNNLNLQGAMLYAYDGTTVGEQGFLLYPEAPTVTLGAGGNLTASEQYQVVAVYARIDAKGQIQRSKPSTPTTFNTTGSDQQAVYAVPPLPLTLWSGTWVEFYRTSVQGDAPGVIFYLAATSSVPAVSGATNQNILNNPYHSVGGSIILQMADNLADSDIISNPTLYTTGGVLPNEMPNACLAPTVYADRLWVIDATQRNVLWASQSVVPGQPGEPGAPIAFSSVLLFNVDTRFGSVVALVSFDDKMVALCEQGGFWWTGQGPDETGNATLSGYTAPLSIPACPGCTSPHVVLTDAGAIFQTTKGFWLLTRGLQLLYIGADVQRYNGLPLLSATLIPNTTEVRFVLGVDPNTGKSPVLIYDYYVKQWANHLYPTVPVDACVWNQGGGVQVFSWLDAGANIWTETPAQYTDAGNFIPLEILTGQIQVSALQGFAIVRDDLVLGTATSPCNLRVQAYFDRNPTAGQDVTIVPAPSTTYGTDIYGDESPYGGPWAPFQWLLRFNRLGMNSVQLRYTTQLPRGQKPGAGISLSAHSLSYDPVEGPNRVPRGRVVA